MRSRTRIWTLTFATVVRRRLEGITFDTIHLVGVATRVFVLIMYAESSVRLSLLPRVQRELPGTTGHPRVRKRRRAICCRRAAGQYTSAEMEAAAANKLAVRPGCGFLEAMGRHESDQNQDEGRRDTPVGERHWTAYPHIPRLVDLRPLRCSMAANLPRTGALSRRCSNSEAGDDTTSCKWQTRPICALKRSCRVLCLRTPDA